MAHSRDSRTKICEAAVIVAGRDGLTAMSLDAVAKQAGVTKGGLLHHFRNKEELVHATLTHFANSGRQMLMERIAADPTPGMRWARGIVRCMFPSDDERMELGDNVDPENLHRFMLAMLSVASDRKVDVAPLTQLGRELRDRLLETEDEGIDQLLVWLTIDGLLVWQILGLIEPSDPLFAQVGDALRRHVGLESRDVAERGLSKTPGSDDG